MNIAIVGYGAQGKSTYDYLNLPGNSITICDLDTGIVVPEGAKSQLGPDHLKNLDKFDVIYRAPIVHPKDIVAENDEEILEKVWSNTNEFFKVCPNKNIIGVTGTKGKGTTSTLIAKMLEADGKKVHLGGNIGTPPLEMLKNNIQPKDWVVLELANFQLIDLKYSPKIAVCLMVVPEHLDWHQDIDEYIDAKSQLFIHQETEDIAIYYAKNDISEDITHASEGKIIPYFSEPGAVVKDGSIVINDQKICDISDVKLLGEHNLQNICAAVTAVWQITQNPEAIKSVIVTFTGLPYRLELIRELDGVKYYNDSFGTTPETAIVAIEAFSEPIVLIAGGSDKGSDYYKLINKIIESNVKHVICIGVTGDKIADLLEGRMSDRCVAHTVFESSDKLSMLQIVQSAREQAEPHDIVLLSTGSASFGLFQNYKDRGDQFNQEVSKLV